MDWFTHPFIHWWKRLFTTGHSAAFTLFNRLKSVAQLHRCRATLMNSEQLLTHVWL